MKPKLNICIIAASLLLVSSLGFSQAHDYHTWQKLVLNKKIPYAGAFISINGTEADHSQLRSIADSNLVSVRVYNSKAAKKKLGITAKKGAVLVKTRHGDILESPRAMLPDSTWYTILNNDTVYTKLNEHATLATGDGTAKAWPQFLSRNLNPDIPVVAGAPAGIYVVLVRFIINPDGTIGDIQPLTDPGYGTTAEALRVVRLSGRWNPVVYKGKPVTSMLWQSIKFVVTED